MNPFSLPTDDSLLYQQRELQRYQKSQKDIEDRSIPIYERSPEVKIPSVSFFRKSFLPSLSPVSALRKSFISNRENLDDFIQRKREILYVKKSIESKKKNIEKLEFAITEKERSQKETLKQLEDHLARVEKYEESLMFEANKKAEQTELKIKGRIELQNSYTEIIEKIEKDYVLYERKLEELRHLEEYKNFLEEIRKQTSPNESVFITEENLLFKSPLQILESINLLELNNLFQVGQTQEAEQELETLRIQNLRIQNQVFKKNENLALRIKTLEKQKETLSFKLKNSFKEDQDLIIDKETLAEIHERLLKLIGIIGVDTYSTLSDLEMLEIIENSLQEKLKIRNSMDQAHVNKMEREIEKARRTEMIDKIKEKEEKKRMETDQVLEKRKLKISKKIGRALMPRSKIAEKIQVVKDPVIPQNVLDRIEFLDENK